MTRFLRLAAPVLLFLISVATDMHAGEPAWLRGRPLPLRRDDPAIIRGTGSVHWRPYGAAAFEDALRLNKPLFIFMTSNWCERGRLMERVTFADLAVATRLNEDFVPVQLNRDERPDVDFRLQQAAQALGGSRGLPLNIALTPNGRAFFAGTFFLADDDPLSERVGLLAVLQNLSQTWKANGEKLQQRADELDAALRKANEGDNPRASLDKIDVTKLIAAAQGLLAAHALVVPPVQGGGLFPAPSAMELCLSHHDAHSLELAAGALNAMLRGGIYDQLEGGFYRSSTDPLWIVPRFEKVLSLNAGLLSTTLHVWQRTADPRCRQALEETIAFWMNLRDADGTFFYASQAGGNSDLDEGQYATWSVKEIERVLRDDVDCQLAKTFYDIQENGDPQVGSQRNVLFEFVTVEEAARRLKIQPADAEKRLPRIRDVLRKERALRPQPALDKNIYVDANALMAAALIECGRALKNPDWTEQGLKTLRALLLQAIQRVPPAAGAVHVLNQAGKPRPAVRLLNDEAALIHACAIAFESTSDKSFANEADAALRRLDEEFWDAANGGFFDRGAHSPLESEGAAWRTKVYQDTSEASPNGLLAQACVELSASTGRAEYLERAQRIVEAFGSALEELGPYSATLGTAVNALKNKPRVP